MNYKVIALLVACITLIAAAGCTGLSDGGVQSSSSKDTSRNTVSYTGGYSLTEEKVAQGYASSAVVPVPTQSISGSGTIETKIIKTATLELEVQDVTSAAESLKSLAIAQGGYLSSTNIRENYNKQLTGTVILRVPQASFDATVAGAKALGTVTSFSSSGEDVTEEYVDLEAQKASYTNQLAQYNAIMKQSTKIEDIIKVQEQIDRVQTQLDRLNGRLKYMDSQIDMSTITVYLEEPEPVGGQTGHDFVSAINEGIAGFLGMIDAIIIIVITLLPLVIIGGAGYWVYQRYKGKKSPAASPVKPDQQAAEEKK